MGAPAEDVLSRDVAAGTIVNAPLGKIYLMTADHCFTDKTEVSDFEFWMLLFNYYTQCGNDTSPPVTQLIQVCIPSISKRPSCVPREVCNCQRSQCWVKVAVSRALSCPFSTGLDMEQPRDM